MGKLTDVACKSSAARVSSYKVSDGEGLTLVIKPSGSKLWQLRYRFVGIEKTLSLGQYPLVTLKEARAAAQLARKLVSQGGDPSAQKKAARLALVDSYANTFEAVALEWLEQRRHEWTDAHAELTIKSLRDNVFDDLGNVPINEIDAPRLLLVLRKIERRGALEIVSRVKQRCGSVFRYGIATGKCRHNPAADLKDALKRPVQKHYNTVARGGLPELLRDIEGYQGKPLTIYALRLVSHTFVRTGELLDAEWSEFDLDKQEWVIPAARMKMRRPHLVPLSSQVIGWLTELRQLTGMRKHLFPNRNDPQRPASHAVILRALGRMGWSGEMTGHGFRSVASTHLNEHKTKWGIHRDVIELQLAHVEKNASRSAYNFAEYLDERKEMMQRWSDYLGGLAAGAAVVQFKRA